MLRETWAFVDFVSTECWGIFEPVLCGCQGMIIQRVLLWFSLIFFSFNFLYIALHFVNNVLGKISTPLKTVLKRLVPSLSLLISFLLKLSAWVICHLTQAPKIFLFFFFFPSILSKNLVGFLYLLPFLFVEAVVNRKKTCLVSFQKTFIYNISSSLAWILTSGL